MEIDENFDLKHDQVLRLKKERGYTVLEFSRPKDKELNNIIEFWRYDSRKPKGESSWLTENDFKDHLDNYLSLFPVVSLETIQKKDNTK
jgi:hypothetical protein